MLQEISRTAEPSRLSVTYVLDGLLVGSIGQVSLAIWRSKPTPELFEVQRRELVAAVSRNPGKVAFLCVVEPSADAPEQDVRDASAAMITSLGTKLVACACVIEGSGFRAAITRTVLTGMALVSRSASPNRFFEHVSVASAWLEQCLGRARDSGLAENVERARIHLDATPKTRR